MRRLLLALVGLVTLGCSSEPLIPYSLDTVPLILAPASRAGVVDLRGRFREVYCAVQRDHGAALPDDRPCDEIVLRLADEPAPRGRPVALGSARQAIRVVVVPGIFGECVIKVTSPLSDARSHLETHGYRTGLIHVSGTSGTAHNARQIRDALAAMPRLTDERLVLVGYSKGAADVLEAITTFPEVAGRVAAVVSLAGVIAGSPLADGLGDVYHALLKLVDVPACDPGDALGLVSLRRSTRLAALARTPLPPSVTYFSVGGIIENAQASALLRSSHRRLSQIDPRNDGQVVFTDTVIPGGHLLGFVRADHWAIALPFSRTSSVLATILVEHNAFPREVLLEAIVRTVEEVL